MSAPSSWMSANANGWSSGCCSVGLGHPRPRLDRAGRADLDEVVARAPRRSAGSHSSGGTSTRSPLRMPMIRCSVSAVMNAPITGPSDRLYGNVIVLSTKRVNDLPFASSRVR